MARAVTRLLTILLAAVLGHSAARADEIEQFYKGRQVKLVIGAEAGSDYDLWARMISRHLGRHMPGEPLIVPQNMPGAGQILATNHLYNIAERDGSVIGMIGRNLPYLALTGDANTRFDPRKFGWIGSPEMSRRVCAARAGSAVQRAEEIFTREFLVGGAGAGTAVSTAPLLLSRLLGAKIKLIEGYRSGPGVLLGMERGEIDGICITLEALKAGKADDLASGKLRLLFHFDPEAVPMSMTGARVPSIFQFASTDEQRRILDVFNASVALGRPMVVPPGVPSQRIEALRKAFEATIADSELRAEAARQRYDITLITGATLAARVDELMRTPPELVKRAEQLLK